MNSSQFDVLFSMIRDASFRTRYWDGKSRQYGEGSPEFEIVFKKEPSFSQLLESPSILFGEAYMRGDIEISGSYEAVAKALNNVGAVDFDSFRGKVLGRALAGLSSAVSPL